MREYKKSAILVQAALAVCLASTASAIYWDASGDGADAIYGGDGTWSTSISNWNTSPTIGFGSLTTWTNGDSATFLRGTTGTVTVSGTVQAASLSFGSSGGSFTTGVTAYTFNDGIIDFRGPNYNYGLTQQNGSTVINGTLGLFGGVTKDTANRQRLNLVSGSLTLANVQDISGVSGPHQLSLEGWGGGPTELNNITKGAGSSGITLFIGGDTTSNSYNYTLGGNNTGLTGTLTLNHGILNLTSSTALAGTSGVSVSNTAAGSTDSASILITTGGVTINKAITGFAANDTTDTRTIGGSNTSGTSTFSGDITLGSFAASGNGRSLRVTAAAGGTTIFSGNITDSSNTSAITKTGLGTVSFTRGAGNNYDGGTTVSSGTLLVGNASGSATGTGNVTVNASATLGGNGIINPATGNTLTNNGLIAPGNAGIGTLTIGAIGSENDVIFGASSKLTAEISGDNRDLLAILGGLTLNATGTLLDVTFLAAPTQTRYVLATYTPGQRTGEFASLSITGDSGAWAMDYATDGQVAIVIPEPTAAMFLGGVAAFGVIARRRRT